MVGSDTSIGITLDGGADFVITKDDEIHVIKPGKDGKGLSRINLGKATTARLLNLQACLGRLLIHASDA